MDLHLTTRCKIRHGPVLYDCAVVFDAANERPVSEGTNSSVGARWGPGYDSAELYTAAEWDAAENLCGNHRPSVDACSWDDDSSDGGTFTTSYIDAFAGMSAASTAGDGGSTCSGGSPSTGSIEGDAAITEPGDDNDLVRDVRLPVGRLAGTPDAGTEKTGTTPGLTAVVTLSCQDQGLAPGQFAVFYQGELCIGSAVILEAL